MPDFGSTPIASMITESWSLPTCGSRVIGLTTSVSMNGKNTLGRPRTTSSAPASYSSRSSEKPGGRCLARRSRVIGVMIRSHSAWCSASSYAS